MQASLDWLEITFITCGQTQSEARKLCDDEFSGGLSTEGKKQAQTAATFINSKDYKLVICSPCPKATETCSIVLPGRKPITLSSVGPYKFGCLAHHPLDDFYRSLLHSTAPEREFKVKGSENLEQVRKRVKEFFTRVACALMWEKPDAVLNGTNYGYKFIVVSHEIWIAEMVEYIQERNRKISEIIEGRFSQQMRMVDHSDDLHRDPKIKVVEASPDVLETYNKSGVLPFTESSPYKKTKVLEAKRIEIQKKTKEDYADKSKAQEKKLKLKVAEREVPWQYLSTGKCSVTVVRVSCKNLHECRSKPRYELSDDFLQYEIFKELSTEYDRQKTTMATLKRL